MNGLAGLSGLGACAYWRIIVCRVPEIVNPPTRFKPLCRKYGDRVIRMNGEGVVPDVDARRARILPRRQVEIHVYALVDCHAEHSMFGPLQNERRYRRGAQTSRLSLSSGIHMRCCKDNFHSVPASENFLGAQPCKMCQTADAVHRTRVRHSVSG